MAEILTVKVVIACISIILVGIYAAYALKLFPNQWRCMYEEDPEHDGSKCKHQCQFCRNIENNQ